MNPEPELFVSDPDPAKMKKADKKIPTILNYNSGRRDQPNPKFYYLV